MSIYGLNCNGSTQYAALDTSVASLAGDFAWLFWAKLESKATDFHYMLSTGPIAVGQINVAFQESTGKLGLNMLGGGLAFHPTAVPSLIGTYHLIVAGRRTSGGRLAFCVKDGTVDLSTELFGSTTTFTNKDFEFMRRADANVDRYAKGVFSQPVLLDRWPSDAEIESIAAGSDPLTVFSGNIVHYFPMPNNTDTSTTDTQTSVSLLQVNMPVDNTQWVLVEGPANLLSGTFASVTTSVTTITPAGGVYVLASFDSNNTSADVINGFVRLSTQMDSQTSTSDNMAGLGVLFGQFTTSAASSSAFSADGYTTSGITSITVSDSNMDAKIRLLGQAISQTTSADALTGRPRYSGTVTSYVQSQASIAGLIRYGCSITSSTGSLAQFNALLTGERNTRNSIFLTTDINGISLSSDIQPVRLTADIS
ncbi:hypothetical protein [Bowmanella sp. JS7-9]|uniref:Uncharacterized protein n=1 Tax=Pseudobowmanella zhangzhouensis TaxID=1537679 RepID=A0ABW1XMY9_9ALTE|nr:hypothetical protein [Bowmanella sp. JS7-9]TBX21928.1 hypothetical protein TK45_10595 [Bowmanella sp. JS7-9]